MFFIKTPAIIQKCFPAYVWRIADNKQGESEKSVYLTFDDGPFAEITEWVLEQLDSYRAKATFFV